MVSSVLAESTTTKSTTDLSVTIHKIIAVGPSHQPVGDEHRISAWLTADGKPGTVTTLAWDREVRLNCPALLPQESSNPSTSLLPIRISLLKQLNASCDQAINTRNCPEAQHICFHYNPATNLLMGSGVIGRPGKPTFYISPYNAQDPLRQVQIWFSFGWPICPELIK